MEFQNDANTSFGGAPFGSTLKRKLDLSDSEGSSDEEGSPRNSLHNNKPRNNDVSDNEPYNDDVNNNELRNYEIKYMDFAVRTIQVEGRNWFGRTRYQTDQEVLDDLNAFVRDNHVRVINVETVSEVYSTDHQYRLWYTNA